MLGDVALSWTERSVADLLVRRWSRAEDRRISVPVRVPASPPGGPSTTGLPLSRWGLEAAGKAFNFCTLCPPLFSRTPRADPEEEPDPELPALQPQADSAVAGHLRARLVRNNNAGRLDVLDDLDATRCSDPRHRERDVLRRKASSRDAAAGVYLRHRRRRLRVVRHIVEVSAEGAPKAIRRCSRRRWRARRRRSGARRCWPTCWSRCTSRLPLPLRRRP